MRGVFLELSIKEAHKNLMQYYIKDYHYIADVLLTYFNNFEFNCIYIYTYIRTYLVNSKFIFIFVAVQNTISDSHDAYQ